MYPHYNQYIIYYLTIFALHYINIFIDFKKYSIINTIEYESKSIFGHAGNQMFLDFHPPFSRPEQYNHDINNVHNESITHHVTCR